MCLVIVDTHLIHDVLSSSCSADFMPIREAILTDARIVLVYGGTKLKKEYRPSTMSVIAVLDKAGRAKLIPDHMVDEEIKRLESNCELSSDDQHIIALARVSGARLLCSLDHDLHCDFRDKNLITKPRGSVYQKREHAPLIRRPCASPETKD